MDSQMGGIKSDALSNNFPIVIQQICSVITEIL